MSARGSWIPVLAAAVVAFARAGLLAPAATAAEPSAPATPSWLAEAAFDGFLSTSYSINFNRPASRTNQLRIFDFDDESFKLDVFELVVQRPAPKPRDSGFRVDLAAGSSVPRVAASAGLFRDEAGRAGDLDLQQAYATWVAPVGAGLRLDMGKFITPFGYEVIEGYDGWNDNATRSLLFGYAIPFTHVGVRASYAFSPQVAAMAMVVNGWDVAVDNNRAKSGGAQLALTPIPALTVYVNGMYGAERTDDDADPRGLLDLAVVWKATARLALGLNGDYGTERNGAAPGRDASWSGVAGYARGVVSGPFSLILRGECFADPDGVRTGRAQYLSEATLTPELRVTPRMIVRADVRVDRSNQPVFEKRDGTARTQPTALLNLLYAF